MSRALIVINGNVDRQKAAAWAHKAPVGTRIEFKAAKRTLDQNSLLWAALTDVAQQATHMGQKYTPDEWKILFMHACGREVRFLPGLDEKTFVPWGQSSSDLSKQEMTDLIETIFAWGASHGVIFNDNSSGSPSSRPDEGSATGKASGAAPISTSSQEAAEAAGGVMGLSAPPAAILRRGA